MEIGLCHTDRIWEESGDEVGTSLEIAVRQASKAEPIFFGEGEVLHLDRRPSPAELQAASTAIKNITEVMIRRVMAELPLDDVGVLFTCFSLARWHLSIAAEVHDCFAEVGGSDQPGSLADDLWQVALSLRRLLGDGLAGETLSVTSRIIEHVGEAKILLACRAPRRVILAACAGIGCKLSSSYSAELGLEGRVCELWVLLGGPDSETNIRLLEPRLVSLWGSHMLTTPAK